MTSSSRNRRGVRALATGAGLGLAAATVTLVATPAQAAPVSLTLLDINDFHGRIDANTAKFATHDRDRSARPTARRQHHASSAPATTSAPRCSPRPSQQDQPTIDVLNAMDLDASAVGNHEFDKGFADLTSRVIDGTDGTPSGTTSGPTSTYKGTTAARRCRVLPIARPSTASRSASSARSPRRPRPWSAPAASPDLTSATGRRGQPRRCQLSDGNAANARPTCIVAELPRGRAGGRAEGRPWRTRWPPARSSPRSSTDTQPAGRRDLHRPHPQGSTPGRAPSPAQPGKTRPVLQTGNYGDTSARSS